MQSYGKKPFVRKDHHDSRGAKDREVKPYKQPAPLIQTTTLWEFPSQHYGESEQGDGEYAGVTPSYVIWNLLQRYTKPGDTVLDPMCGSGTTLDVCKDLDRIGLGFDLQPQRPDVKKGDARKLPVPAKSVDFVFVDPPYSTHIKYSGEKNCIGELNARGGGYYEAMEEVLAALYKTMKDGAYLALYVQDSFAKGKEFAPLGFELFLRLSAIFDPVDVLCVVRHNKKLKRNHWHTSAIEGNYFLRGFNYLFVMRKNAARTQSFLKHESSSSLSFFFRQVAAGRPADVITPAKLAEILKTEQEELHQKLKATRTEKPKHKVDDRPRQNREQRSERRPHDRNAEQKHKKFQGQHKRKSP